eukprot:CAMPEP_0116564574 /NCGR_PEP_ID=MMETSP0397-20121206/13378_1 /TAXON_ID=216820 /ORGANISM="Cyclophora tenuis, Strain ECT3854" /LENGTH=108 /DNA_ID=CAMNT_0004091171 /DNA_START=124 /DNA_END=450 /DNA_ORIENTATION=-
MDLPGINGNDLSIHHADGVLSVEGTRLMTIGDSSSSLSSVAVVRKYKFMKCFAMEGDVIDSRRMSADMTQQTTLVICAPKIKRATPLLDEFRERPLETIHESWNEVED